MAVCCKISCFVTIYNLLMQIPNSKLELAQPWDALAQVYANSRQVSADQLIEWPAQLRMCGDFQGKRVLDVGCARVGITGTQTELARDAESLVQRIRKFTELPIAIGFGISTNHHVRAVNCFADAAVVGSAVVELIERTPAVDAPKAVGAFVADLFSAPACGEGPFMMNGLHDSCTRRIW